MKPYYEGPGVQIFLGDCRDVLPSLAGISTCLTDPPYGLGFMGKGWDHAVPGVEFWTAVSRALLPGAALLAFGGTRLWHRLAVAIEDAGFEMRDTLMWIYGSGFPKSLDVSKAIDKRAEVNDETTRRIAAVAIVIREYRDRAGLERAQVSEAVVGTPSGACWNWEHQQLPSAEMWPRIKAVLAIPDEYDGLIEGDRARFIAAERAVVASGYRIRRESIVQIAGPSDGEYPITAPATDAARQWEGWGTALKPAWEPILLARKPLDGTVAANVQAHGTGALNIDGCRIAGEESTVRHNNAGTGNVDQWRTGKRASVSGSESGRWPANVVLDSEAARLLDEQSGDLESGTFNGVRAGLGYHGASGNSGKPYEGNRGGASRFFYTSKASRAERNWGCDDLPKQFLATMGDGIGGHEHNPKHASAHASNDHPTVKPLDLMRWLARLTKSPNGGTVLDPFMGSGSTLVAAREEFRPVIGIEREERYCEIASRRLSQGVLDFGGSGVSP